MKPISPKNGRYEDNLDLVKLFSMMCPEEMEKYQKFQVTKMDKIKEFLGMHY